MEDYKTRLLTEYWGLTIRINRLEEILDKYGKRELDFKLNCPADLLFRQYNAMLQCQGILEERIDIEIGRDYRLEVTNEFLRLAKDLHLL